MVHGVSWVWTWQSRDVLLLPTYASISWARELLVKNMSTLQYIFRYCNKKRCLFQTWVFSRTRYYRQLNTHVRRCKRAYVLDISLFSMSNERNAYFYGDKSRDRGTASSGGWGSVVHWPPDCFFIRFEGIDYLWVYPNCRDDIRMQCLFVATN